MAGMSWEQYYDGFYEWSSGTQIRYLARLDSYGSGAQTAEIAAELAEAGDGGPAAAKRLIMRAVENGVRFTAEDVIEMAGADIEEDTLKYALATVREPLTGSQIVTLSDYFDEDVLEKLIKDKRGGLTPEEMSSIDDRDMSDGKLARAMAAAEPRLSPGQILALMYALDEETLSRAVTESREPFTPEQITELTDYVSEKALSEAVMKAKEAFTPEQVSDLLYYVDEDALSKAVRSTKEPFTPEQIIELVDNVDEDALSKAVRSAKEPFTPEQVTELIDYVDDGALSKAVKNTKGKFTKEQREELEDSGFCFSNGIFEDTDGGKESRETVHEFGGAVCLACWAFFWVRQRRRTVHPAMTALRTTDTATEDGITETTTATAAKMKRRKNKSAFAKQRRIIHMLLSVENWHTRRAFGDEGAVETIARAGFDGIDYSFNDMFDWDEAILAPGAAGRAEKLRLCAEKNGVRFIQAHAPFHFLYGMEMSESEREFYSIVRAMEHASWLGVPVIVVHGIDVPGYVDVFDYNARFYNALRPYCRRFGIKAAVENLFEYYADGTVTGVKFGTAQSYCKMIDMLDPECFTGCVDVGHARLTGNRPGDFIRSAGRRVGCVHMHCNDGKRDMHMLPRLVPFEWEDIMKALDDAEYSGAFNFELIGYLGKFEKELLPQALQFAAAVGRRLIEMRRQ